MISASRRIISILKWIHEIHKSKYAPPDGHMWARERLTKIQATSRPNDIRTEVWSKMRYRKPKLDAARRLKGIHYIALEDQEFDTVIKNAR